MTKKQRLPLVAICGRPNVGKSTLFNRIIGRQHAIVHSEEGITRDRSYGIASWNGKSFRIVDTGGIVDRPGDDITKKMMEQARAALTEADAIILLVDGQTGVARADDDIRNEIVRHKKPIFLVVNKLDNEAMKLNAASFYSMGLGDPFPISSSHGDGVDDLLAAIAAKLPETRAVTPEEERQASATKVAIVGRPNAGKSSFINAILNEDRSIVTDVPGTTRDSINIEFHWKDKDYLFIDTAGMRKKGGIKTEVERFSVTRALRSINFADVCLVMIDATQGIGEQDKRIFNYIQEAGTGMVLVWTKWDLVDEKEDSFKKLAEQIDLKAPFLASVPAITVSNTERQRIFKVFEYIDRVAEAVNRRVQTSELNKLLSSLQGSPQARHHGQEAKIRYATQVDVKPARFVLFVNRAERFHFSYLRHIENRIRETYGFEGVPIHIELREGGPKE
jgi:GTP-binding protein